MWTALAATGVLGLLLGWAVRGLRLRGKLRKAEGERNIAQGVLAEKETELEALYAAGREPVSGEGGAVQPSPNDQDLRATIAERDERLQSLSDELARSKAELNDLRSQIANTDNQDISAQAVGTAVAGIAAGTVLAGEGSDKRLDADIDQEEATLEWRNRYLESRVRNLEDTIKGLSNGSETPTETTAAAPAAPAAAIVASTGGEASDSDESDLELVKLKWKSDYLKQRLSYFEKYGLPGLVSAAGPSSAPAAKTDANDETDDSGASASDEEIASLRWRNRYLEGRLAYYEGDKAVEDEGDSGIAELAESTAAVPVSAELTSEEPVLPAAPPDEPIDVQVEKAEDNLEPEDTSPAADGDASTQDVVLVVRGVKPLALEGPVDGEGDDLTAIGGIGPKIQEVLNGFGIFHYDQIAAWTPENVEWVDDHLAFEGRIEREQWVQQAEALSNVT